MRMLELFSGSGTMAASFKALGWDVVTIDNNPKLKPTILADVTNIDATGLIKKYGKFDVVWASPPCTCFSVASIGTHWTGGKGAYLPKTDKCLAALKTLFKTIDLITELNPEMWFIENPTGMMRKMPIMRKLKRRSITYCQYGENRKKPTDIWTNTNIPLRATCKNGMSCHEAAPRGSKTGTQGLKGNYERSILPKELCEKVAEYCNGVKP